MERGGRTASGAAGVGLEAAGRTAMVPFCFAVLLVAAGVARSTCNSVVLVSISVRLPLHEDVCTQQHKADIYHKCADRPSSGYSRVNEACGLPCHQGRQCQPEQQLPAAGLRACWSHCLGSRAAACPRRAEHQRPGLCGAGARLPLPSWEQCQLSPTCHQPPAGIASVRDGVSRPEAQERRLRLESATGPQWAKPCETHHDDTEPHSQQATAHALIRGES